MNRQMDETSSLFEDSIIQQLQQKQPGVFSIPDDTQIYFIDSEHHFFTFTHHLTLFDINARGYVHPVALSYITRDPDKIVLRFEELMEKFNEVSVKMKRGNYSNFTLDLRCRLLDLEHTQLILQNKVADKPALSTQAIQQTIAATKLMIDTLESSTSQMNNLSKDTTPQGSVEPPKDYKPKCIDTLYPVPHFERKLRSLAQLCQEPDKNDPNRRKSITQNTATMIPLVFSMMEAQQTNLPIHSRTTLANTIMHNMYAETIKSIQDIAHHFGKSSVILDVEDEEKLFVDPVSSALTIGRTLMLNMDNPQPRVHEEQHLVKEEGSTMDMKRTDTEYSVNDMPLSTTLLSIDKPTEEEEEALYYPILFSPLQLWKSSSTNLLKVLAQYQSLIVDVIFSLLIGRTVLIQGSTQNKGKVQQVVRALSVFVPGQHKERHQIIDWFDSARLTQSHIASMKLVGINKDNLDPSIHVDSSCVLDIDIKNGSLNSSPVYVEGQWINQLLDRMMLFTSDESYLAYLHTVFMNMSLKAFIYHHLYLCNEFDIDEDEGQSSTSKGYLSETNSESSTLSRKWSIRLMNYLKKHEDQDTDTVSATESEDHSEENQATVTLQDIIGQKSTGNSDKPRTIVGLFDRDSSSEEDDTSLNFDMHDLAIQQLDSDSSSSDEDNTPVRKGKKHRFRKNSDIGPDGVSLTERRGRRYLQDKLKVYGDDQTIVVYLATCVL
ncbi:uncharacterized protein B0P05DRAFT_547175 [Gilbertella persicaria]|uniref:uncharacterized protein n=1 Tax=Gilbertella persicaria TaxID=101096 RepID=UPI0022206053|nr:uncharacterized protein B0P05DRAFT_547175 [Gilbertella persicaria]KAI8075354.1 hypothetical protein B0P05DRAFT_547175 [Gilbertella persicaria]